MLVCSFKLRPRLPVDSNMPPPPSAHHHRTTIRGGGEGLIIRIVPCQSELDALPTLQARKLLWCHSDGTLEIKNDGPRPVFIRHTGSYQVGVVAPLLPPASAPTVSLFPLISWLSLIMGSPCCGSHAMRACRVVHPWPGGQVSAQPATC